MSALLLAFTLILTGVESTTVYAKTRTSNSFVTKDDTGALSDWARIEEPSYDSGIADRKIDNDGNLVKTWYQNNSNPNIYYINVGGVNVSVDATNYGTVDSVAILSGEYLSSEDQYDYFASYVAIFDDYHTWLHFNDSHVLVGDKNEINVYYDTYKESNRNSISLIELSFLDTDDPGYAILVDDAESGASVEIYRPVPGAYSYLRIEAFNFDNQQSSIDLLNRFAYTGYTY